MTAGLSMIYSNPDNARNIAMKLQEDAQAKAVLLTLSASKQQTIVLSVVRGSSKAQCLIRMWCSTLAPRCYRKS